MYPWFSEELITDNLLTSLLDAATILINGKLKDKYTGIPFAEGDSVPNIINFLCIYQVACLAVNQVASQGGRTENDNYMMDHGACAICDNLYAELQSGTIAADNENYDEEDQVVRDPWIIDPGTDIWGLNE